MKRFNRFLHSPYHNNKEQLITLFEQIRPFYPSFREPAFNRKKIWEGVHGKKPYNPIIFKKLFFELNALTESFLVIEEVKSNQRTQEKLWLTAIKSRGFDRFEKETKALSKKIKAKQALMTQDDFLDLHLLHRDLWYHSEKDKHQTDNTELEVNYYYLYTYSAFEKLKTISEIETRKKYLNIADYSFSLDLNLPIDPAIIQSNATLTLINQFKDFVSSPSLSLYLTIRDKLLTLKDIPDKSVLQDGILHLNNYLVGVDNKGQLSQIKESFGLFKWAAAQKIFIINGSIYEHVMVNSVIFAVRDNQISWAKTYLNEHEIYLKSKDKELTINYLRAVVSYYEKDFEKVIQLLATLQPGKTMHYYLSIKSILLRALFELMLQGKFDLLDTLVAQLESLEKGLRRNHKFSKNRIRSYLNFIKIFHKLITQFLSPNKDKLVQLNKEINRIAPLLGLDWFMEKIEAINKVSRS